MEKITKFVIVPAALIILVVALAFSLYSSESAPEAEEEKKPVEVDGNMVYEGPCGDFGVVDKDLEEEFRLSEARDACAESGWELPSRRELMCICENQAEYGDNFKEGNYWSDQSTSNYNYYVSFPSCDFAGEDYKPRENPARCILRQEEEE